VRRDRARISLERIPTLFNGTVVLPRVIERPPGNHAWFQGERIQLLSGSDLSDGFIGATHRRQEHGIHLVSFGMAGV
jgi:hypothetical protein